MATHGSHGSGLTRWCKELITRNHSNEIQVECYELIHRDVIVYMPPCLGLNKIKRAIFMK